MGSQRTKLESLIASGHAQKDQIRNVNRFILELKADVRSLNICAAQLGNPQQRSNSKGCVTALPASELEAILKRFPLIVASVQTKEHDHNMATAINAITELEVLRSGLMAKLGAHVLGLKAQMDRDFGPDFLDIQSFLKAEADSLLNAAAAHYCSQSTVYYVNMVHQYEIMAHTTHGLRAVREGLSLTTLVRQLTAERDKLIEKEEMLMGQLRRYIDMTSTAHGPDQSATSSVSSTTLKNKQRVALEEKLEEERHLKDELASLKKYKEAAATEIGRLNDAVNSVTLTADARVELLASELVAVKAKLESTTQRADMSEAAITQLKMEQCMLHSATKRQLAANALLHVELVRQEAKSRSRYGAGGECEREHDELITLRGELERKDRLVTVAMAARDAAVSGGIEDHRLVKQLMAELKASQQQAAENAASRDDLKEQLEQMTTLQSGTAESALQAANAAALEIKELKFKLSQRELEIRILEERTEDQVEQMCQLTVKGYVADAQIKTLTDENAKLAESLSQVNEAKLMTCEDVNVEEIEVLEEEKVMQDNVVEDTAIPSDIS